MVNGEVILESDPISTKNVLKKMVARRKASMKASAPKPVNRNPIRGLSNSIKNKYITNAYKHTFGSMNQPDENLKVRDESYDLDRAGGQKTVTTYLPYNWQGNSSWNASESAGRLPTMKLVGGVYRGTWRNKQDSYDDREERIYSDNTDYPPTNVAWRKSWIDNRIAKGNDIGDLYDKEDYNNNSSGG